MKIGALSAKMVPNLGNEMVHMNECWIPPSDVPEEGEVKLYYSRYNADSYYGLLQVWLNGRWGNVTDSSWTIEDTNVVSHQLGRNGIIFLTINIICCSFSHINVGVLTSSYYSNSYNEGFPVVMSNTNCVGTESRLIDCSYSTGGSGSAVSLRCSHNSRF